MYTWLHNATKWMNKDFLVNDTNHMQHLFAQRRMGPMKARQLKSSEIGIARIIDCCYRRKYADIILSCADGGFAGESARALIAVNYMELLVAGTQFAPDHQLDTYDWIPQGASLPHLDQWFMSTFVNPGANFEVNVSYHLKKATRRAQGWKAKFEQYRKIRNECGSLLYTNYKDTLATDNRNWRNNQSYIKDAWMMNKKLDKNKVNDDEVYSQIQEHLDRFE